ncbi:hypothetical protein LZ554_008366 [Drepanopeziza brunnea f. sp. 'monogermtubi']|nr:hypothetical protein LZ554_008366 [Drepanopeziza brunnea f. sp. 'monogermtubi']
MTTTVTPFQVDHGNVGITMERTPSGNSIMSDTPQPYSSLQDDHTLDRFDSEAAHLVETVSSRLPAHTKHSRILRSLIHSPFPIDDIALASILHSTNLLFFSGVLSGRVEWEWSSAPRYSTELIGTTALRRRDDGDGYECLIVLSEPILRDEKYDRRLLLSAFFHELIHCYLFVLCGFEARRCGGHTAGFRRIAGVVDRWVGEGVLGLGCMRANLLHFRKDQGVVPFEDGAYREERWRSSEREQEPNREREREQDVWEWSPRPESGFLDSGQMMVPRYY